LQVSSARVQVLGFQVLGFSCRFQVLGFKPAFELKEERGTNLSPN
jgi:hypothetical protein